MDGKPEKGERKVADDCVLLINEILESSSSSSMDATVLFRMGLLEYALERSPYNFDISVALLKIYDEHGLSTSFNQHLHQMNLKGVQLESLGYFIFRHVIDWFDVVSFKSYLLKYSKYLKLNAKDLKSCKIKALTDLNFDQIENFIEYEAFLSNSYYAQVVKTTQQLLEVLEGNTAEHGKLWLDNKTA